VFCYYLFLFVWIDNIIYLLSELLTELFL